LFFVFSAVCGRWFYVLLSEVSTADEVALVYAVYGTYRSTVAAARAFIIVDNCEVVNNLDSSLRTILLTFAAAYTSVGTIFTDNAALIVIGAFNNDTRGVCNKMYNAVGAGACTNTAAYALSRVNACHAVLDRDSILRADAYTVAVAEAGKGAKSVARICHIGGDTGFVTLIVKFFSYDVAGTVAGYVSDLFYNVLCLYAEYLGDALSGTVAARDTEISLNRASVCECLSIAVTAAITAGSAVCTGEAVTDSYLFFVYLDTEEYA